MQCKSRWKNAKVFRERVENLPRFGMGAQTKE
jgi:hypothetical protein